jgi:hypothetical protein
MTLGKAKKMAIQKVQQKVIKKSGTLELGDIKVAGSTILSGTVSFNGYQKLSASATPFSGQTHVISPSTTIVGYNTSVFPDAVSGSLTGSLFAAASVPAGTIVMFKDEGANADGAPFVINCAGADTIDGDDGDLTLEFRKGSASVYSDGVDTWYLYSLVILPG